ncbi:MAG: FMN-binding protein [Clostridia bacterium]|nr:FMN-binding protein [Clostridia bacterium]
MSNIKRIIILAVVIVILGGAVFGARYIASVRSYKENVNKIKIEKVDLSKVNDGIYTGVCDVEFINVEVKVTVKDHRIEDIELVKHKNGKGGPAEVIIQKVLDKQSLDVDIISGASNSSRVILEAVENALNSGKK